MTYIRSLVVLVAAAALAPAAFAQQQAPVDAKLFAGMRWRSIGPYRGGRTRACAGVPGRPATLYIGVCNGGVWKSVDYGRMWRPVFDGQPTGSVGSIAVAPSDPNVVYVGSGEGLQRPDLSTGDGIYRSADAGATWAHLGLRDGQQIPEIAVDPRDPNRLFVAVLGHPYGPNAERGIFRSTDGGKTFEKVLFVDENTGASDVLVDPKNPDVVYAAMWEARQGPWENSVWRGTSGGIFKSTDGGATWRRLAKGLPQEGVNQADLAIAASDSRRIYAAVATTSAVGIYRSDDAGESWYQVTTDPRPARRIGGGDLPVPAVDPSNPDVVVMTTVVAWRSTDGGKTWSAFRGAPGGDDYQHAWIDPTDPNTVLMTSDQGAVVTVDGGRSWSSWYNQPTAQMYHVSTDNAFPYRVCGGQQESGSACVSSRGDDGQITFREWHPVGAEEYGNVTPDPLDPDVVYGGKVTRYDRRTGQTEEVAPRVFRSPDYRVLRTMPLVFSPVDPHALYFSSNTVWKTTDGGRNWTQISPDLTRETWVVPASVGKYRDQETAKPTRRGVVYALALSPLDANLIWAGTDDGLVHVTSDGGAHWRDVTPPELVPWAKVSVVEASHFDAGTAYAAVNTIRLDDLRPYIYRTRDGGKTWTRITNGIPDGETVNAVREDPRRRGLLFAATEREVYVSFDDGGHWQSLRLNMPASSVRDIAIKNDDLIAATHGRGFWILDDITPLRQIDEKTAATDVVLFAPQTAYRVRWDTNTDTPLPPDEPAGQNPPDGAVIDYYLGSAAPGPVTIDILDGSGLVVRHYSSEDPSAPPDPKNIEIPPYWVRPSLVASREAGMHRFVWDLHHTPAPGVESDYPISAIVGDTPLSPTSPWALPGAYTVRLTASGRTITQPLTIVMDPRVKTPEAGLREQFALSIQVYDTMGEAQATLAEIRAARKRLEALSDLDKKAAAIEEEIGGITGGLARLFEVLQAADVAPTPQAAAAVADRRRALDEAKAKWKALKP